MNEFARRTLLKAITYRVVSLFLTLAFAYAFSGDAVRSSIFAVTLQSVLSVWYYVHERLWLRVHWGVAVEFVTRKHPKDDFVGFSKGD